VETKLTSRSEPFAGANLSAWNVVAGGFAVATVGLLFDLPTIGSSGTSIAVSIGIAALIAVGILLAAAGMLQLRNALDHDRTGARRGLGLQSAGWLILLVGVLGLQISTSIAVLVISSVFVAAAAASAIAGGMLLRAHHSETGALNSTAVSYLILGTALIFLGVGVILASKVGYYFVLPDVASTVVNDLGAAISASGCVIAGYSAFGMAG
jgi:hypothetical protein